MIKPLFLGVPRMAREAGLSERHIYRLIAAEELPVFKIRRAYFITRGVFEEWKKKHLTGDRSG